VSWADRIVPACQHLADLLTQAGVPATLSRSTLRVPGAWVLPATATTETLSGAGTVRATVLLVAPSAGNKDQEALEDLAGLLARALTVITPDEDVDTSVVFPHNNNALPAFRLSVDLDLEE
jgi:hypothetical protein